MNDVVLLLVSLIGIINSLIIIVYSLKTKKGNKTSNVLFAVLIIALTVRISKSILLTFSDGLHDILLTLGLSGFLAIGPVYMLFIYSVTKKDFKLKISDFLHFIPAVLLMLIWFELAYFRSDYYRWNFIYQLIMLQYMIYMIKAINQTQLLDENHLHLKKQINILSGVLLFIWFLYYLNAVTHFFPYIAGAIIYSIIIYFSINLIVNKGYVLDFNPFRKYQKTGIDHETCKFIINKLNQLFEKDKVFKNNTLSLAKLAKMMGISSHQLSQAINSEKKLSYFELLADYRIREAQKLILENGKNDKIENIAYEVGYNSISAFNTAFKKITGQTPTNFRDAGTKN